MTFLSDGDRRALLTAAVVQAVGDMTGVLESTWGNGPVTMGVVSARDGEPARLWVERNGAREYFLPDEAARAVGDFLRPAKAAVASDPDR